VLALIAGQGRLPGEIVAALDALPHVAALEGFPPDTLKPDEVFRIEHLGSVLSGWRERGVREICLAGAVRRPPIDQTQIDAATMPLVPRIAAAMGQGDDALLRTIVEIFEEAGMTVRGAHEIAPDLLPPAGPLAGARSDAAVRDTARARAVLFALGNADVGQACVVKNGQVLALEGLFGTDWMLQSLAARPDGSGGILCKAPKPGQDRRVDLPTIGIETVRSAAAARLDGIVIEAGGVLLLDRNAVLREAEAQGLFLFVEGS
jgi:hypothetical protein